MATQDVFIRQSSGLTRQISAWDALMYCAMNPGLLYSLVYIVYAPAFYQGAHMGWAVLFVLMIFPVAGLYWYFSTIMPRSGGEYIYISRTLHPSLGLWACGMISITSISWTGVITDWWIRWGLSDPIRAIGIVRNNDGLVDLANNLDKQWVRWLIGSVSILGLTTWLFLKGTRAMMKLSYWAVAFGWLAVIILGLLVVVTGRSGFEENFNRLSGSDYNTLLQAGQQAGAVFKVTFLATMYAGVTYVALNTLGQTFSANLAGEIRGVQKSQALALFGSLAIQMAIWYAAYQLLYAGAGRNFIHALNTVCYYPGSDACPPTLLHPNAPTNEVLPTLYMAFFTGNPILLALFGFCFILVTWVSLAGLAFAPIRNVFAWSFDRLIPAKFAEIRTKYRAPLYSIVAVILVAYIFFLVEIFKNEWVTGILYSIAGWFLGWIVLGIAGIVFPFRRKELFESGPPATQRRLGGVPVISILGFLTLAVSVFIEWAVLKPYLEGAAPWSSLWPVYVMAGVPVVIYVFAHFYHKRSGIPLSVQFSQVPPE
jgi:amino acid transporter